MRKTLWLLFLCFFLITGCGESEYDKNMREGRSHLKSSEYDLAIESFKEALIEKPSSEDAQTLLDMSTNEKIQSTIKQKVEDYTKSLRA